MRRAVKVLRLPKSSAPCLQSLVLPCQQLVPYRSYNGKVDNLLQLCTGNSPLEKICICASVLNACHGDMCT